MLERLSRRLDLLTAATRDIPARQRTMRAPVQWSYELLNPDEHELFVRLGVFSGGCTLDGAEAVCQANLDTLESLDHHTMRRAGAAHRIARLNHRSVSGNTEQAVDAQV